MLFQSLFSVSPRVRRKNDSARTLELEVQQLEPRKLLAGNVSAHITGAGDLVINGDAASNNIEVAISATGVATITARAGETIDAGNLATSTVTGDVRINMRGGGDVVELNGTFAADPVHDIRINGGAGEDYLIAQGFQGVSGKLTISAGSGDDRVYVGNFFADGDVTINTASGNDDVFVNSSGADQVAVKTSGGDDFVNLDSVTLDLGVSIITGSGQDTVIADEVYYGRFSVNSGGGGDSLILEKIYVDDEFLLVTGGGADGVRISLTQSQQTHINLGGGHDEFSGRNVDVSSGEAISIVGGSGNDLVGLFDTFISGDVVTNLGGGIDTFETRFVSANGLRHKSGGGADLVLISETAFADALFVMGGGNDTLTTGVDSFIIGTARGGGGFDEIQLAITTTLDHSGFESVI